MFLLCSSLFFMLSSFLYCGSSWIGLSFDNGNIGFQLLIILLFPLILWIAGFETKSTKLFFLLLLLIFGLFICFTLLSLLLSFICYECLIIILFFSLFLFIPSFYRIRTAFFSFLFSIFWNWYSLERFLFIFWIIRIIISVKHDLNGC